MRIRSVKIIGIAILSWFSSGAYAACSDSGATGKCDGPIRTVIRIQSGVLFGFISNDLGNLGCALQPHSDTLSYIFIPANSINEHEYTGLLTISQVSGVTAVVEVSSTFGVPCTVISVGLRR